MSSIRCDEIRVSLKSRAIRSAAGCPIPARASNSTSSGTRSGSARHREHGTAGGVGWVIWRGGATGGFVGAGAAGRRLAGRLRGRCRRGSGRLGARRRLHDRLGRLRARFLGHHRRYRPRTPDRLLDLHRFLDGLDLRGAGRSWAQRPTDRAPMTPPITPPSRPPPPMPGRPEGPREGMSRPGDIGCVTIREPWKVWAPASVPGRIRAAPMPAASAVRRRSGGRAGRARRATERQDRRCGSS
jgi:hypothetical protein